MNISLEDIVRTEKEKYNVLLVPVGFSDHTIGTSIPLAAVALGSCVIEKHFTTDKNLPGWDHEISADPIEMKEICVEAKNVNKALGNFKRIVSENEIQKRQKFRRSIVVNRDIEKGDIIKLEDLSYKRPGTGISPDKIMYVIGRKLKQKKLDDELLLWEDLE